MNQRESESNNDVRLPWPTDAVMVVGEKTDDANVHQMTGEPVEAICRMCSAKLCVDTWTVERSRMHAYGRPTKFFCTSCFERHENPMAVCDVVEDHRFDTLQILKDKTGKTDGDHGKRFLGNVFPNDYQWSDDGVH